MSGSRAIMLSLSVRDADVVRRELERMGTAGEAALKKLDDAARKASERGGAGGGLSPIATAASEVARSFEGIGARLGPLGAGLSALGAGGAAAAASLGAVALAATAAVRAGDELTQTLSRLTAAVGSQQAAVAVYDQLYRLSLQTGQAVGDTASAFARFSIATREVGGTNEQALALTRTLQQAAIVAGASGQEAASAALQLGQALASGVLQGDELRSLLEAMPNLAQALARELGVSVGELRRLGSEGQLTADRVMPALLRAGEQIREQFEQMPPSLARGFSAVSTATSRFLGELDRALGTSQSIAERLMGAARIIDRIRLRAGLGTAEENAATAQQVSESRVATLRADITRLQAQLDGREIDGVRTAMPSGTRSQIERQLAERREQLEREEQVLREALEERNRLAREADEVRQAEEASAGLRRVDNERRRNAQQTQELEEALDRRVRAQREYDEAVRRIERARFLGEGAGGVSQQRADELLRAARERFDQAVSSGSSRQAERASADADAHVRAWEQAQERLANQREAEERRELERRERENERTTDSITSYLANSFTDAFRETGGGFRALLRSMQQMALATPIRLGIEAVARPIVSSIVSDVAGAGGISSLLGLSGLGSSISSALGFGGLGTSLSGFLAAPLFGEAALTSATNSALGSMGGMLGPAAPAQLGLGGVTIGQALGGIGGGFMIGSTLGGMIARTPAQRTNANIGAGAGAAAGALIGSIIPGIGTVIGGLIGGALGGAGGGLFGPSRRNVAYHQVIEVGEDGLLRLGGSGQKHAGAQLDALRQQTAQEIAAINSQLQALGLRASGSAVIGADRADPSRPATLSAALSQFTISSNDARVQGAIARAGGSLASFTVAQEAASLAQQLDAFAQSVKDAADPLGVVRRQFDAVRATAERLGFGLEEVNQAQERALQQAREQLMRPVTASISSLADFALRLRTANDNAGTPMSRLAAADAEFSRTVTAALSGDAQALSRVQSSAETFRTLSREVFGTGSGFVEAERRIIDALDQIGSLGSDALTASVLASETRNQTDTLVDALARLQAEVTALRREVQQGSNNPLTARAA